MSLTEGQPLAGQIRSRRICPSLAAFLKFELFRVYLLPISRYPHIRYHIHFIFCYLNNKK
ncbi:hypothetical protein D5071_02465 [Pectobacterium carotovorum]|uniref:Uncharacterized protein n=1 Tax=Pectobacterium carotovorum TaxID=554 RepID=A0A419B1C0_PECCA|nr:hypothetical protein D5071_02465 [Pectobacterium carotovorum]